MKITSMSLHNLLVVPACLAVAACVGLMNSTCSADITLAVDFLSADNGGGVTAAISDFALQDGAIDLAATVNAINAEGNGFNALGETIAISGTATGGASPGAITSSITISAFSNDPARTGTNGAFGANFFAGSPFSPITDDYLFLNGNDNVTLDVDTSSIVAGSVVTVVAYSHGDQGNQIAGLELTAGGLVQTSGLTSAAQPFETFTFTQGVGETSLSLELLNDASGNQFGAINGFSITSVAPAAVPEPSSLMILLAMGSLGLVARRRR